MGRCVFRRPPVYRAASDAFPIDGGREEWLGMPFLLVALSSRQAVLCCYVAAGAGFSHTLLKGCTAREPHAVDLEGSLICVPSLFLGLESGPHLCLWVDGLLSEIFSSSRGRMQHWVCVCMRPPPPLQCLLGGCGPFLPPRSCSPRLFFESTFPAGARNMCIGRSGTQALPLGDRLWLGSTMQHGELSGAPKKGIGGSGSFALATLTWTHVRSASLLPFLQRCTPTVSFEAWFFRFLGMLGSGVISFFRSLGGSVLAALLALLVRRLPGKHSPGGRVLSTVGCLACPGVLLPLGLAGSPNKAHNVLGLSTRTAYKWRHRQALRQGTAHSVVAHSCRNCDTGPFTFPVCLWQQPANVLPLLKFCMWPAVLMPEPLPDPLRPDISHADLRPRETMPFHQQPADTLHPCLECVGEAPILNVQVPASAADEELEEWPQVVCTVRVFCPMMQTRTLTLSLDFPCLVDDMQEEIRRDLVSMYFHFPFTVRPTMPQLSESYGTFVIGGIWLESASTAVVVIDLSARGGPTFARHVQDVLTYQAVADIATSFGIRSWAAFLFGAFEALRPRQAVRTVHGGVVQLCPEGVVPRWVSPVQQRLQDPMRWPALPILPSSLAHNFLVLGYPSDGEHLVSRSAVETGAVALASLHVDEPDGTVLTEPVGAALRDVLFHGEPCLNVLCAAPASYVRTHDTDFHSVFIDARQAGQPIRAIYTSEQRLSIAYLAQCAGITSCPTGFHVGAAGTQIGDVSLRVSPGQVVC